MIALTVVLSIPKSLAILVGLCLILVKSDLELKAMVMIALRITYGTVLFIDLLVGNLLTLIIGYFG